MLKRAAALVLKILMTPPHPKGLRPHRLRQAPRRARPSPPPSELSERTDQNSLTFSGPHCRVAQPSPKCPQPRSPAPRRPRQPARRLPSPPPPARPHATPRPPSSSLPKHLLLFRSSVLAAPAPAGFLTDRRPPPHQPRAEETAPAQRRRSGHICHTSRRGDGGANAPAACRPKALGAAQRRPNSSA